MAKQPLVGALHCFRLIGTMDRSTRACCVGFDAQQPGHFGVRWICARTVEHPHVMPGLVPGIHVFHLQYRSAKKTCMPATSAGMTGMFPIDQLTSAAASWRKLWRMRSI